MIRHIANSIAWATLLGTIGWTAAPVSVALLAQVFR